jgi:hypothetical protein
LCCHCQRLASSDRNAAAILRDFLCRFIMPLKEE